MFDVIVRRANTDSVAAKSKPFRNVTEAYKWLVTWNNERTKSTWLYARIYDRGKVVRAYDCMVRRLSRTRCCEPRRRR